MAVVGEMDDEAVVALAVEAMHRYDKWCQKSAAMKRAKGLAPTASTVYPHTTAWDILERASKGDWQRFRELEHKVMDRYNQEAGRFRLAWSESKREKYREYKRAQRAKGTVA